MNKDLDERLVPSGEYRDALNIEVINSEGDDAGSVQTTMGNVLRSAGIPNGTCVGSIANEKEDKIYWMVAHPRSKEFNICQAINTPAQNRTRVVTKDIIVEYDFNNNSVNQVVVDIYNIAIPILNGFNTSPAANVLDLVDAGGIHTNMIVTGYDENCNPIFKSNIESINNNSQPVLIDDINNVFPLLSYVVFSSKRVLNFDQDRLITGINIIPTSDESTAEGVLFWTDNHSEPKRININRSKLGSTNWFNHTNFIIRDTSPGSLPNAYIISGPIEEQHVTVIKKGPPTAPVLEMRNSKDEEITEAEILGGGSNPFLNPTTLELEMDTTIFISFVGCPASVCPGFEEKDILIFSCKDDPATDQVNESDKKIRGEVKGINTTTGVYEIQILSGDPSIRPVDSNWDVELEKINPLFQFKFPRFGYRYKYEDGEYSAFSPFSQVAFLPDDFYYLPKEGYNLGMVNQLRYLAIKDFVHPTLLPDDVISIDILYKESNSPNVYSVKTIKRKEFVSGIWDEWNGITSQHSQQSGVRGFLKITSELIHATLPSNQLLRPWDNVPRKALAQEISGNRLIYGNYLQNYDLYNNSTGEKDIDVQVTVSVKSRDIASNSLNPAQKDPWFTFGADNQYLPSKSIKTLRTYQVGVVYIDEYGRETPVFSNDKTGSDATTSETPTTSTVYVGKPKANQANALKVNIKSTVPEWAKAFKYFVKETSNEYYNLAMDRWYDAEDGNVWISFPSSERNKVDEDTFLILKKEHDDNIFVESPARYKILAIENEAPTFIKQENRSMGIFIDDKTKMGMGGIGFPLPQTREVKLDGTTFQSLGWHETVLGSDDIHTMYLRIRSSSDRSNWYKLASVAPSSSATIPDYIIKTKKLFGDDMSLTSVNNDYGSRYDGLELEIVNRKPTHKAEFDGRFFVKVLKDTTFINRIIKPKTADEQYITKYSKKVQYINTQSPHDNSSGPTGPGIEDWYGFGYDKRGISYHDDPHGGSHWGWEPSHGKMNGQNYWDWAGISTKQDYDSTGWFIDKVESFRRFQFIKRHNQQERGQGYRTEPDSKSNHRNNVTNEYGSTYTNPSRVVQALHVGTGGIELPPNNTYKSLTSSSYSANEGGQIVKSVGIDRYDTVMGDTSSVSANEDVIHLSFAGYGGNHCSSCDPNTWAETKLDLSSWSDYAADIIFGNEISTPGTLWSWKEDPDQIIYKTIANPGISQTNAVWSANTIDAFSAEKGVGLYNYVSFHDYLMRTHHYIYCTVVGVTTSFATCYWASAKIDDYTGCGSYGLAQAGPVGFYGGKNWVSSADGYKDNQKHNNFPQLIEDFNKRQTKRKRFQFIAKQKDDETLGLGSGPRAYLPTNDPNYDSHFDSDYNILDTHPILNHSLTDQSDPNWTPAPGVRFDGMWSGMGDTHPKNNGAEIPNVKTWDINPTAITDQSRAPGSVTWQIKERYTEDTESFSSINPAIWETEPKEDIGLDIYHEVGQIYPVELNKDTIEQHIGPVHRSTFVPDNIRRNSYVKCWRPSIQNWITLSGPPPPTSIEPENIRVASIENGDGITLKTVDNLDLLVAPQINDILVFVRSDGSSTESEIRTIDNSTGFPVYHFYSMVHGKPATIPWHNCYSFGNGVESDRIRDDYNQVTIDNGPKASMTLEEPYLEERRCSGLIYSGIYNSISGVNNLNQFVQAEKITKDLNPNYGCIQKLHSRNTDLLTLCEDKILTILANKDAMFNADGNVNVTSNLNVLGQAMPASKAEYGISKNPESFASQANRVYFADKSRGTVLRFGQDGLTPISSVGMKDYFSDNLRNANTIIGSFDDKKGSYNITFNHVTLTYTEATKGWTSFKSFIQESGLSLNSSYYTFKNGDLWEHHINPIRNNFYGNPFDSSIKFLFNDLPSSVKSFNTLNYEGSQARITQNLNDPDYYNNISRNGWYVDMIRTNLQTGNNLEFKSKEGKWFGTVKGETTTLQNLDTREFSVQGIGNAGEIACPTCPTSWQCVDSFVSQGDCDNLTIITPQTPFLSTDDFIEYVSDPANGYDTLDPTTFYACVELPPQEKPASGLCTCGNNGIGLKGFRLSFIVTNVYVRPITSYTSWNYFITALINDWNSWATNCPLTSNMTFLQFKAALDNWIATQNPPVKPVIGIAEPDLCNCTTIRTCECVEQLGSQGYASKSLCETGQNCCGSGWYGCTDPNATNYDPNATIDDGSCIYPGCIYCNDPNANTSVPGCCDNTQQNYDPNATCDDGSCIPIVFGCMDDGTDPNYPGRPVGYVGQALNYYAAATVDNGTCIYAVYGCTDPLATNYNPNANVDDGSCVYVNTAISNCASCSNVSSTAITSIPDNAFEAHIKTNYYGAGVFPIAQATGDVLTNKICSKTSLNIVQPVQGALIADTTGLQDFKCLEILRMQNSSGIITHLDLSGQELLADGTGFYRLFAHGQPLIDVILPQWDYAAVLAHSGYSLMFADSYNPIQSGLVLHAGTPARVTEAQNMIASGKISLGVNPPPYSVVI